MLAAFVGLGRINDTADERLLPVTAPFVGRREGYHRRQVYVDESGDSQKSLASSDQDAVLQKRRRHANKILTNYTEFDRIFESSVSKSVDVLFDKLWRIHMRSIRTAWNGTSSQAVGISLTEFISRYEKSIGNKFFGEESSPKSYVTDLIDKLRTRSVGSQQRNMYRSFNESIPTNDDDEGRQNLMPPFDINSDNYEEYCMDNIFNESGDNENGCCVLNIISAGTRLESVVKVKSAQKIIQSALLCPAFRKTHGWSFVRSQYLLMRDGYTVEDLNMRDPPKWLSGMYQPRPSDPKDIKIVPKMPRMSSQSMHSDERLYSSDYISPPKKKFGSRTRNDASHNPNKSLKIDSKWGGVGTNGDGLKGIVKNDEQSQWMSHKAQYSSFGKKSVWIEDDKSIDQADDATRMSHGESSSSSSTISLDPKFSSHMSSSSLGFFSSEKTGFSLLLSQGDNAPLEQVPVEGERQLPLASLQQMNHLIDPVRSLSDGELVAFLALGGDAPDLMVRQDLILISRVHSKIIMLPGAVIAVYVAPNTDISDMDSNYTSHVSLIDDITFETFCHARHVFRERIGRGFGVTFPQARRHFDINLAQNAKSEKNSLYQNILREGANSMIPFSPARPLAVVILDIIVERLAKSTYCKLVNFKDGRKHVLGEIITNFEDYDGSDKAIKHWWPITAFKWIWQHNKVRWLLDQFESKDDDLSDIKKLLKEESLFSELLTNLASVLSSMTQHGYKRGQGIGVFLPNQDSAIDVREWESLSLKSKEILSNHFHVMADTYLLATKQSRSRSFWETVSDQGIVKIETAFMLLSCVFAVPNVIGSLFGMNLINGLEELVFKVDNTTTQWFIDNFLTPFHLFAYTVTTIVIAGFTLSVYKIGTDQFLYSPIWKWHL